MMTWAQVVKAVLDLLNSLFNNVNNRKHEDLGRLREAQRQAEVENELVDTIRNVDPGRVSDDEAFGGPPRGDLPSADQK
jgi:hypothetical protein